MDNIEATGWTCGICGYKTDDAGVISDHMVIEHSENVKQFKPREKDRHEKLTDVLESDSYLCFWFNSQGNLMYRVSTKVTDEQLCYIEKMVSMVTEEILKSNIEIQL